MDSTIDISVNQALIGVFALGLLVGFAGGAISPLGIQNQQGTESGDQEQDDSNNEITLEGIDLENEPSLGKEDSEIKIVEYSDYGCPWCAEWAGVDVTSQSNVDQQNVLEKLEDKYIDSGELEFIYKDFPAHPNAPEAHQAANCAYEQDNYWEYHDAIFERRDEWMKSGQNQPTQTFNSIASDIGLKTGQFSQCLENSNGQEESEDAQNIRRIERVGTPTFFIGNREKGFTKVSGAQPYERIEQVVERKLNQ